MSFASLTTTITTLQSGASSGIKKGFAANIGNIRLAGSKVGTKISTDGSTWGNVTLPTGAAFNDVFVYDNNFIAVGKNTTSNTANIWTSTNGTSWAEPTYSGEDRSAAEFLWVTFDGSKIITGGENLVPYATSTDANVTVWDSISNSFTSSITNDHILLRQLNAAAYGGTGKLMAGAIGQLTNDLYPYSYMFAMVTREHFYLQSNSSNWFGGASSPIDYTNDVIYDAALDRFIGASPDGKFWIQSETDANSIIGSPSSTTIYPVPEEEHTLGYRQYANITVVNSVITTNEITSLVKIGDYYYITDGTDKVYYTDNQSLQTDWSSFVVSAGASIVNLDYIGTTLYATSATGSVYEILFTIDQPNNITYPSTPVQITSTQAVEAGLFVRIECEYYRANPGDTPTTEVLKFSNYYLPVYINSEKYNPLGQLLNVSSSSSELRNSNQGISLSISGIPNSSIAEIVNSRLKGSKVEVYRILFDPITKAQLSITGRFQGLVNNYSLEEEYNAQEQTATNTILITCASTTEILSNKMSGRRTNPIDQKELYPNDVSMDRVPNLAKSNFNFGAVLK